jgi:hypothetical protein
MEIENKEIATNEANNVSNEEQIIKYKKVFKNFKADRTLNPSKKSKANFKVYNGTEITKIRFGKKETFYKTDRNNFKSQSLYLFKLVKEDVTNFLETITDIELPEQHKTTFYNIDYDDEVGTLTGTDLNHAYWRIAYIKGYISQNTYEKGLKDDESKQVRLATLGVLGRKLEYDEYENGVYLRTVIEVKENLLAKKIYKDIRFTCYKMMHELSIILYDNFESYNVDCIYYRDTPENRKMVHDYFDSKQMLYKQLVF